MLKGEGHWLKRKDLTGNSEVCKTKRGDLKKRSDKKMIKG